VLRSRLTVHPCMQEAELHAVLLASSSSMGGARKRATTRCVSSLNDDERSAAFGALADERRASSSASSAAARALPQWPQHQPANAQACQGSREATRSAGGVDRFLLLACCCDWLIRRQLS
jgi:hypothetical protein